MVTNARCWRRTAAGWPASFCRGGTRERSTRTFGEELRRAVEVHYVARVDELLELVLQPAATSAAPAGLVS